MELVLITLGAISLLELALWLPGIWRAHRWLAALVMVALGASVGLLLAEYTATWAVLVALLTGFRAINLLRIVEARAHNYYLYHSSRKTSIWLIALQAAVIGVNRLITLNHINMLTCFYVMAVAQVLVAVVILASTLRHLRTTKPPKLDINLSSRELPTVTVAIPARNETDDLELCLRSLIASDYPKLEILVLDDCSQNKRTPEIIRDFAHDGVRFVAGKEPPQSWLAKNYAYSQLADEANGEILLFCGVDTRFEPESIKNLVRTLLQKQKSMVSVLPRNLAAAGDGAEKALVQPSRYAWELSLPRRLLGRPPVLSTCWMITREALQSVGGFNAVRRKVVPESYLAKVVASKSDGYSFLQSDDALGISSRKSFDEQLSTAIRVRYPQLHRRPELVFLNITAEFLALIWPLMVGMVAAVSSEWLLAAVSLAGFVIVSVAYAKIVNLTYRRFSVSGIYLLPVAALYDIGLLLYSMWQYEFSEVLWKGRNVCLPVMRVIPALPKSEE